MNKYYSTFDDSIEEFDDDNDYLEGYGEDEQAREFEWQEKNE